MASRTSFLNSNLAFAKHTPLFGIKLWVLILAFVALFTVLVFIVVFLFIICLHRQRSKSSKPRFRLSNPVPCTNIRAPRRYSSLDKLHLLGRVSEVDTLDHHRGLSPKDSGITTQGSGNSGELELVGSHSPRVISDAGKGNRVSLREIEMVTNGFSDENVIGHGDRGVVYRGILLDTTRVAVKRLWIESFQPEDFVAEVEAIRHARHRNLVRLIGYCVEEGYRIVVNEYIDNGNLHQWLHTCPEQVSPLTWRIRSNIIQGIAKGLAYLHEDVEPKIVHRNLKSSNILLDHQWNPKISDFGIAKLLDCTRETAHSIKTSGYSARGVAYNGEGSDVYSFGILVMEIICGRAPVDHNQPQVFLVDWLKSMVANQKIMYVVDPRMAKIPSAKELKRIILLALRCVDGDIKHRPTMGDVIHMLEPRDLLLDECERTDGCSLRNNSPDQDVLVSGERHFSSYEKGSSGVSARI